jgi:hypothetical protein
MEEKAIVEDPEVVEVSPSVHLVITGALDGEVRYLAAVGSAALSELLRDAARVKDYPVHKQENQLDDIGQDIYLVDNYKYFGMLCGAFTSLSWDSLASLSSKFSKDNLKYTFVVNF